MPTPPAEIVSALAPFAPLFSSRTWRHVPVLVVGALLAPGQRLVSAVLRVLGLGESAGFQAYHRVLNRARWSSLAASRVLLGLLVAAFAPAGPLVVGIDETIERRRGPKIAAAGLDRDPVRSSRGYFVKVRGLRWVSMMLLVPIPWAGRIWALPSLTALAPSGRYDTEQGRRHKSVPAWARQMIRCLHRWQPDRRLVVVGDSEYAALDLLAGVRAAATVVARLRLDARLFAPAPPRRPGQKGRPRRVGARLPSPAARAADPATAWTPVGVASWYGEGERVVEAASDTAVWYHPGQPLVPLRWVLVRDPDGHSPTQALLCTDPAATPEQVLAWFVRRWQLEVTFHEVRAHLGVETQRQWAPLAIRRTTPALLGLFSLVTLLAHERGGAAAAVRPTAWYAKATPTFVDALALVRRHLWAQTTFPTSAAVPDLVQVPRPFVEHLYDLLCYAA